MSLEISLINNMSMYCLWSSQAIADIWRDMSSDTSVHSSLTGRIIDSRSLMAFKDCSSARLKVAVAFTLSVLMFASRSRLVRQLWWKMEERFE